MDCDPYSCLGFYDMAMSDFCIDGLVGGFAAAHLGQQNACSPLNALMRCIQRALAGRALAPPLQPHTKLPQALAAPAAASPRRPSPAAPALRRAGGLNPEALHNAVWVDDTVFVSVDKRLHGHCP